MATKPVLETSEHIVSVVPTYGGRSGFAHCSKCGQVARTRDVWDYHEICAEDGQEHLAAIAKEKEAQHVI